MLGWVFGLGYFGFGVYWIHHSLYVHAAASWMFAALLTALLIMCLALYIAVFCTVFHQLQRRYDRSLVLSSLPLLWFVMEWSKGWVLSGFPWLSLGYAHIDSPLAGFAPVIGVYGIGALSLWVSLGLVEAYQQRRPLPLLIPLIALVIGGAMKQIEWTRPLDRQLGVSMIQADIPQEIKWRHGDRQGILDRHWALTQSQWQYDLIVWSESAIPGRQEDMQQDYLEPMARVAEAQGSHLLAGIVVSNWLEREYFNSMLLLGAQQGVYHKRHLVPFGEYTPLRAWLGWIDSYLQIPMADMTPGARDQPLIELDGITLGVSICFEDLFSRVINRDLPAANLLVNASNDAWFGASLAPHQHLQVARMRALETGRVMVRSTNRGPGAFIDHRGKVIDATEQFQQQTLGATLQARTGATPFVSYWRLQPYLTLLILLIVTGGLLRRTKA